MELPALITLVGVGGGLIGGVGSQFVGWFLHRSAEQAQQTASETQATANRAATEASETRAELDRLDLNVKFWARIEAQDEIIARHRTEIEGLRKTIADLDRSHKEELARRDAAHRAELAERDQLVTRQQLVLSQQGTEIQGLRDQLTDLHHQLDEWQIAARHGREALRDAVLASTVPVPPTTPPGGDAAS